MHWRWHAGSSWGTRSPRSHLVAPLALAMYLAVVSGVAAPSQSTADPVRPVAAAARPNIVLITADDMAASDLQYMPHTRRLLGVRGVSFTDFVAPHPMCCPSRAQLLTGQYAQNNGVHHNRGANGGFPALREPDNTVARWLHDAGYQTALVGKFMNGWNGSQPVPAGWDQFNPLTGREYQPYGYTAFRHGRPRRYPDVHTSDYVADTTVNYVERFSRNPEPFFIWSSQVSPHLMKQGGEWTPPVPPARHADLFPDAQAPSVSAPSFNEPDRSDKPTHVQQRSELSADRMHEWFRARIRSLQAVDEGVVSLIGALRRTGRLSNTIIAFTSDNGYLLGEHALTMKNLPYEEALRVPLLVRGPGFPAGRNESGASAMIDLAPTFVGAAGATPGRKMDGQSLLDVLNGDPVDTVLVQAGGGARWWWRGVRDSRFTYVEYEADGFVELYDRQEDPWQLTNVAGDPGYLDTEVRLRSELARLKDCSGAGCR